MPRHTRFHLCLWISLFALLVIAWQGLRFKSQYRDVQSLITQARPKGNFGIPKKPEKIKNVPHTTQLLLNGDLSARDPHSRWRAIHLSDRTDPVLFWAYLLRYKSTHQIKSIPEDFDETVARIAPDNGWFQMWKAARKGRYGFGQESLSYQERQMNPAPPARYRVPEKKLAEEVIGLLHQAASKPEFYGYTEAFSQRIFRDIPLPKDLMGRIKYQVLQIQVQKSSLIMLRSNDLTGSAFQYLIEKGDREGFQKMIKTVDILERAYIREAATLLDMMIVMNNLRMNSEMIIRGCEKFKLNGTLSFYKKRLDELEARRKKMKDRRHREAQNFLLTRASTIDIAATEKGMILENPRQITKADLRPGLRSEHAMMAGLLSGNVSFYLILAIFFAWCSRVRQSKEQREHTITLLDQTVDRDAWKRLIIWGSMIPFFGFILIRFLTPLGQLDYNARLSMSAHYWLPFWGLALLLVFAPLKIARKIVDPANPKERQSKIQIITPICGILLTGVTIHFGLGYLPYLIVMVAFCTLLLWLLWIGGRSVNSKKGFTLRRAVISRLMLISLAINTGLGALAALAFHMEERFWISRPQLGAPSGIHTSREEADTIEELREEMWSYLD